MRRTLALVLAMAPSLLFAGGSRELVVAAVQLRVDSASLASPAVYERALRAAAAEATRGRHADLIVFPEYTSAFFAIAGAGDLLGAAATSAELLAALHKSDPTITTPADFFASRAATTEGWIREVFGQIARERHAWVVAGTWFAPDGSGGLRNRALVFSPDGSIAYSQDKVFLTDIEEQLLRMNPGTIEAATGLRVAGQNVRLTICRDTFDAAWEARHRGADLWIDIKANGAAFDGQQRESFGRALPARLGPAGARFGLTVCLVGSLLEFAWEGESSFVRVEGGRVTTLRTVATAAAAGSLLVRVPTAR